MSLSTDTNTRHGSVWNSKAGELTELGGGSAAEAIFVGLQGWREKMRWGQKGAG